MKGKVIKYEQDNIDTDVILPGPYLKLHEHSELAEHAMAVSYTHLTLPTILLV